MTTEVLSSALLAWLQEKGLDADRLLSLPPVDAPQLDASHTLNDYFISSSHNTYLTAHQLFGDSSASQYSATLERGARCVEIDSWDGDDGEPIVYHGFTLTSKIGLRSVVESIDSATRPDSLPVVVSFECHLGPEQQKRAVEIMKEVWGDKLVTAPLDGVEGMLTVDHARGKILLKVEYCRGLLPDLDATLPSLADTKHQSSSDEEEDEKAIAEGKEDRAALSLRKKKKKAPKPKIVPELAQCAPYSTSLKPHGADFLVTEPARHWSLVANISESALAKHIGSRLPDVIHHNAHALMRVYPKGSRISSGNLQPLPFWRSGSQIVAMNFQQWDRPNQLNEALFTGSNGWLLKPPHLRIAAGDSSVPPLPKAIRSRVDVEIVGACNLPRPKDAEKGLNAYIELELCTYNDGPRKRTKTIKAVKDDPNLGSDPLWNETISFEAELEHFAFIRFLFNHADSWHSRDDRCATYCAFVPWTRPEYRVARLFDLAGKRTDARVLFKIQVTPL